MKLSSRAEVDTRLNSVASLGEPTRRALYLFVVGQDQPVSREQAAAGLDVAHHIAKFHLDKLEADGLLDAEHRRPHGRSGPGAGRPTKFYRRADRDIEVSLPQRRYDFAGQLMAEAITQASNGSVPVSDALRDVARDAGQQLGRQVAQAAGPRPSQPVLVGALCDVLREVGYEPKLESSCITLANCPFHDLAQNHTALVCGMNVDLFDGIVAAIPSAALIPELTPNPGRCCVTLTVAQDGARLS